MEVTIPNKTKLDRLVRCYVEGAKVERLQRLYCPSETDPKIIAQKSDGIISHAMRLGIDLMIEELEKRQKQKELNNVHGTTTTTLPQAKQEPFGNDTGGKEGITPVVGNGEGKHRKKGSKKVVS